MNRVGLDIGATKVLGVVLDDSGRVIAQVREPSAQGVDGVVATAAKVVDALRDATGASPRGPIGVGVPGLVDVASGSVQHAVNLGLDDQAPLRDLLADRLDHPVVLENDVNAATLGAAEATGARDLALISVGTGLAAGLVLDGVLRRGVHAAAGEIGHVPVDPAGRRCECGQVGCLETIASGSAVARAWPSAVRPPAVALFAAAEAGDTDALAVRDALAGGIAAAVRMLCLAVDVDHVVLGGGVAQLGEPLAEVVRRALRDQARDSAFLSVLGLAERISVVPSDIPVAAVGAALLGRVDR
ncbi:ROK family protein [Nocardioides sp. C4-1]|uniref:ROK family protein n=1 Tax=Nocardioides sp. C4-1 TaxID=3151851 RepID=UPI0032649ED2